MAGQIAKESVLLNAKTLIAKPWRWRYTKTNRELDIFPIQKDKAKSGMNFGKNPDNSH